MARQVIQRGSLSNDGTGDSLRQAAQKINENFVELYQVLGGDSDLIGSSVRLTDNGFIIEGQTNDAFETFVQAVDPTQDNHITFPDASGALLLDSAEQTITNKTLIQPSLQTPFILADNLVNGYSLVGGAIAGDININLPILLDSDTLVFLGATQTLVNKTLTAPTISSPKILTAIQDANGAELIAVAATGSAVNHISITNAATGNSPTVAAAGDDTNITLNFAGKGNGGIRFNSAVVYGNNTMTASGAAPVTNSLTYFNSGSALAITLANGNVSGQSKKFVNINSGVATVTPANFAQGTSFALQPNGAVEAIWSGSNWHLLTDSSSYVTIT